MRPGSASGTVLWKLWSGGPATKAKLQRLASEPYIENQIALLRKRGLIERCGGTQMAPEFRVTARGSEICRGWIISDIERYGRNVEMRAGGSARAPEIAERIAKGETLQSIGDHFGVTRERVRQIAAAAGITTRPIDVRREAQRKRWQSMIDQGASRSDIATSEGIRPNSVSIRARELGLDTSAWRHKAAPLHGTPSRYSRGCRCELCSQANASRAAEMRQRGLPAPDDPRHGTRSGYINWGCRCEACRRAGSEANRAYRARRVARTTQLADTG